jgi:sugar phosphate isomerase/epimerase
VKLTVSTLACPDWPLEQIISVARDHGIDGIDFRGIGPEIDITKLLAFTVKLDQTLALLRAANISMPCLNTSVTLLAPAGERWEAMIEECHRYAKLAARAHAPLLRIFGGSIPAGWSRSEALLMARRRLRQIVKICRPSNCRPLIETHDDWRSSAEVLELLEGVDAAEAGVLWDVDHSYRRGEPPSQTARGLGNFLAHVHIKDSVRVGERSVPKLLGEGELPVKDFLATLRETRYSGWICLETEKRWHADAPDPGQSIPQFAAYMRQSAGSMGT